MLLHDWPGHFPSTPLPPGSPLGRLVRVDRASYEAATTDGLPRLPALPPPEEATVGDWLAVDDDDAVVVVLPRISLLVRGAALGRSRSRALVANVDAVLVCASLSAALPVRRIERLLTQAWERGDPRPCPDQGRPAPPTRLRPSRR